MDILRKLTPDELVQLKDKFEEPLDEEEFEQVLMEAIHLHERRSTEKNNNSKPLHFRELFNDIDVNGDMTVSYDEFVGYIISSAENESIVRHLNSDSVQKQYMLTASHQTELPSSITSVRYLPDVELMCKLVKRDKHKMKLSLVPTSQAVLANKSSNNGDDDDENHNNEKQKKTNSNDKNNKTSSGGALGGGRSSKRAASIKNKVQSRTESNFGGTGFTFAADAKSNSKNNNNGDGSSSGGAQDQKVWAEIPYEDALIVDYEYIPQQRGVVNSNTIVVSYNDNSAIMYDMTRTVGLPDQVKFLKKKENRQKDGEKAPVTFYFSDPQKCMTWGSRIRHMFFGSSTGVVTSWDPDLPSWSGKERLHKRHITQIVTSSAEYTTLYTSALDKYIKSTDMTRGVIKWAVDLDDESDMSHKEGILNLFLDENRHQLATSGLETYVLLHSTTNPVASRQKLEDVTRPHKARIVSLFCPSDLPHQLISSDASGIVKIWDLRMLGCTQTLDTSRDEQSALDDEQKTRTTRLQSSLRFQTTLAPKTLTSVEYFPKRQQLLVNGRDSKVFTYSSTHAPALCDEHICSAVLFNASSRSIMTFHRNIAKKWDGETGCLRGRWELFPSSPADSATSCEVTSACLAFPRMRKFFVGTTEGTVVSFGFSMCTELDELDIRGYDPVSWGRVVALEYLNGFRGTQGAYVLIAFAGMIVLVQDVEDVRGSLKIHGMEVALRERKATCMCVTDESSIILVGTEGGRILVGDLMSFCLTREIQHPTIIGDITSITCTPDASVAAVMRSIEEHTEIQHHLTQERKRRSSSVVSLGGVGLSSGSSVSREGSNTNIASSSNNNNNSTNDDEDNKEQGGNSGGVVIKAKRSQSVVGLPPPSPPTTLFSSSEGEAADNHNNAATDGAKQKRGRQQQQQRLQQRRNSSANSILLNRGDMDEREYVKTAFEFVSNRAKSFGTICAVTDSTATMAALSVRSGQLVDIISVWKNKEVKRYSSPQKEAEAKAQREKEMRSRQRKIERRQKRRQSIAVGGNNNNINNSTSSSITQMMASSTPIDSSSSGGSRNHQNNNNNSLVSEGEPKWISSRPNSAVAAYFRNDSSQSQRSNNNNNNSAVTNTNNDNGAPTVSSSYRPTITTICALHGYSLVATGDEKGNISVWFYDKPFSTSPLMSSSASKSKSSKNNNSNNNNTNQQQKQKQEQEQENHNQHADELDLLVSSWKAHNEEVLSIRELVGEQQRNTALGPIILSIGIDKMIYIWSTDGNKLGSLNQGRTVEVQQQQAQFKAEQEEKDRILANAAAAASHDQQQQQLQLQQQQKDGSTTTITTVTNNNNTNNNTSSIPVVTSNKNADKSMIGDSSKIDHLALTLPPFELALLDEKEIPASAWSVTAQKMLWALKGISSSSSGTGGKKTTTTTTTHHHHYSSGGKPPAVVTGGSTTATKRKNSMDYYNHPGEDVFTRRQYSSTNSIMDDLGSSSSSCSSRSNNSNNSSNSNSDNDNDDDQKTTNDDDKLLLTASTASSVDQLANTSAFFLTESQQTNNNNNSGSISSALMKQQQQYQANNNNNIISTTTGQNIGVSGLVAVKKLTGIMKSDNAQFFTARRTMFKTPLQPPSNNNNNNEDDDHQQDEQQNETSSNNTTKKTASNSNSSSLVSGSLQDRQKNSSTKIAQLNIGVKLPPLVSVYSNNHYSYNNNENKNVEGAIQVDMMNNDDSQQQPLQNQRQNNNRHKQKSPERSPSSSRRTGGGGGRHGKTDSPTTHQQHKTSMNRFAQTARPGTTTTTNHQHNNNTTNNKNQQQQQQQPSGYSSFLDSVHTTLSKNSLKKIRDFEREKAEKELETTNMPERLQFSLTGRIILSSKDHTTAVNRTQDTEPSVRRL